MPYGTNSAWPPTFPGPLPPERRHGRRLPAALGGMDVPVGGMAATTVKSRQKTGKKPKNR